MGCALNIKNTTMERMKREAEKKEGRGGNPDKPEKSYLFFSFLQRQKKKQSGNKQSAKKCFPESLRNFKVRFNPFRQWGWDVLDGGGRALWNPPSPKKNYGMQFKSTCRLRISKLRIWIHLQSKTSGVFTAHRKPENSRKGLRRRRRNTSHCCTMCHQVVKSCNCTWDDRRQERVKTLDQYNRWATFSSHFDEW